MVIEIGANQATCSCHSIPSVCQSIRSAGCSGLLPTRPSRVERAAKLGFEARSNPFVGRAYCVASLRLFRKPPQEIRPKFLEDVGCHSAAKLSAKPNSGVRRVPMVGVIQT